MSKKTTLNAQEWAKILPFFLKKGKDNALTVPKIYELAGANLTGTGLPLRKSAKLLLKKGVPVISCGNGFYLAENDDELILYLNNLEGRVAGINDTIASVRKILYN